MSRRSKFSEAQIIDATAALVAGGGPGAATIGAIGALLDAPSGSIYHRFPSRDTLLGRLWLSKAASFQNSFVAALADEDPVAAGLAAGIQAWASSSCTTSYPVTMARKLFQPARATWVMCTSKKRT